jgi:hypothetical protein
MSTNPIRNIGGDTLFIKEELETMGPELYRENGHHSESNQSH